MVVNTVSPETFYVPATGHAPGSKLPVIVYRGALATTAADAVSAAVETSEWAKGGHWQVKKEAIAVTPHYHGITHEAYTVLKGSATYLLGKSPLDPDFDKDGKPVGVKFTAQPGDVFVWAAGVSHFVTDVQDEYEIMGFHSLNSFNSREEPYDVELGMDTVEETNVKREKCKQVPIPVHDPIYGKEGPLPKLWQKDSATDSVK